MKINFDIHYIAAQIVTKCEHGTNNIDIYTSRDSDHKKISINVMCNQKYAKHVENMQDGKKYIMWKFISAEYEIISPDDNSDIDYDLIESYLEKYC